MIIKEEFLVKNKITKKTTEMVRHYSNNNLYIKKLDSDDTTLYSVAEDLKQLDVEYIETNIPIEIESEDTE